MQTEGERHTILISYANNQTLEWVAISFSIIIKRKWERLYLFQTNFRERKVIRDIKVGHHKKSHFSTET